MVGLSFTAAFFSGVMSEKQRDGWGIVLLMSAFALMGSAVILQVALNNG
jgi:hypothetical protein